VRWIEVFQTIHELGYEGVEIAQAPSTLPKASEMQAVLKELGLEFVGLVGGRLSERIEYCRDYRPTYLYIEDWEESTCRRAVDEGYTLALHPHMYKRVHRLEMASQLLEEHAQLKFLPDTAHLFIAGDDPAEAIKRLADRLIGIHLKDWTPVYGRSFHRYARGFGELGAGVVDLSAVLEAVREAAFDGWLVVEQDCTPTDPHTSAQSSARWLRDHGVPVRKRPRSKCASTLTLVEPQASCPPEKLAQFMDALMHVRQHSVRSFCKTLAEVIGKLVVNCKLVKVWEHCPGEGLLGLLSEWPGSPQPSTTSVVRCTEVLSGITVQAQMVSHFDLERSYGAHQFAHPELIEDLGVSRMISIPVQNTYNPNHVELVVNLFLTESAPAPPSDLDLKKCAEYVAKTYETLLEDVCQAAAARVNLAVSRTAEVDDFLDEAVRDIQRVLNCEAVTILLVNETGKSLEPRATTGLTWDPSLPPEEHFYRLGEGITGNVWKQGEPLVTLDAKMEPEWRGKSLETQKSDKNMCLFVPLTDSHGHVIGVIRCVNKRADRAPMGPNMFLGSDVSVVDAIGQAVVPHLSVCLVTERRAKTLSRLTHELKAPLATIRGAAEFIQRESQARGFEFSYPYADDICSWHDLTRRLLANVDFFRYHVEKLQLRPEQTYLLRDIFAPAKNQIGPLLRERSFSSRRISDDGFRQIPYLWVDRSQIRQVFFNLLGNSVKYAYNDPAAFQVEVATQDTGAGYEILFRDWGPGITDGWDEAIFEEGVRGPNSEQSNVSGDGLGLWVVREIITAHGGTIALSNCGQPTEFRILLPHGLARA